MTHDTRRIALATLAAALVAAVLLVTVVLPAEYGIDPLRTGSALGLTALAEGGSEIIEAQPGPIKHDAIEFVLGPFEMVEYKYRLEQGASMLFSWEATGEVIYDFHSEPDGAPEGTAQSFEKGRAGMADGTYAAPFSGIHGWFWENPGTKPVTITLTTAGFYTLATEFTPNGTLDHEVPELRRR
jgi:hypothetical protein